MLTHGNVFGPGYCAINVPLAMASDGSVGVPAENQTARSDSPRWTIGQIPKLIVPVRFPVTPSHGEGSTQKPCHDLLALVLGARKPVKTGYGQRSPSGCFAFPSSLTLVILLTGDRLVGRPTKPSEAAHSLCWQAKMRERTLGQIRLQG